MVSGLVEVTTLPPIIISEAATFVQATQLVAAKQKVLSAASSGASSVNWKLVKTTGSTNSDVVSANVSSGDSSPSASINTVDLADNDLITLSITGITGSPKDLAITLVFEHVAA